MILIEPRGGLGDALLYSTLPELHYNRLGEYTSIHPASRFRNPEIYDLVYKMNPYITGMASENKSPTAGAVYDEAFFYRAKFRHFPITLIEELHNLTGGKCGPGNLTPKIYYRPKRLEEWVHRVFVDPRSHSQHFPSQEFDHFFQRFERLDTKKEVIVAESKYSGASGTSSMAGYEREVVRDIFHYCDIIFSCREFICTESGGHVLAAALRPFATRVLMTTMSYNSRFFIFPNVIYTVTGKLTPDYLEHDPIWRPS